MSEIHQQCHNQDLYWVQRSIYSVYPMYKVKTVELIYKIFYSPKNCPGPGFCSTSPEVRRRKKTIARATATDTSSWVVTTTTTSRDCFKLPPKAALPNIRFTTLSVVFLNNQSTVVRTESTVHRTNRRKELQSVLQWNPS